PLLSLLPRGALGRSRFRAPIEALVVGIAAFIATAPIVAHHFGIIAPVSIPAGLPAVPLLSLALIGAATGLLTAPVLPGVAAYFASGSALALETLDRVATTAASLPFGHGTVGPPPWWSWAIAASVGVVVARIP